MSTVPRLSMSAMQGPEAAWEPCGDCRAAQGPGDGEGRAWLWGSQILSGPLRESSPFPRFCLGAFSSWLILLR